MNTPTIGIKFASSVPDLYRRRLTHGARHFAAIWGLRWTSHDPEIRLCYGVERTKPGDVFLETAYRPRRTGGTPRWYPASDLFLDEEATEYPGLHASASGGPDWLGDIFEWLGAESEHVAVDRDAIGAVPFEASVVGRHQLDPEVPWAAIAMRGLAREVRRQAGDAAIGAPGNGMPMVAATHDLDFIPVRLADRFSRQFKNAVIAIAGHRNPRLALAILCRLPHAHSFMDVVARERQMGVESSAYLISSRDHRRDANYEIDDPLVVQLLERLAAEGVEIGVHGSYESVLGGGSLAADYQRLRAMGFSPLGGRQHWLRFRPELLFKSLESAQATYDASVGFRNRVGFRSGAPFAYVPWSFSEERPFNVIELPLVVMDAALFAQDGNSGDLALRRAERILRRTRLYGPGGASILWHNTAFAAMQMPAHFGDIYWQLKDANTRWVSGHTAAREFRGRFTAAGLLLGDNQGEP